MERDTVNAVRPTTSSTIKKINNRSFLHSQGTENAHVNLPFLVGQKMQLQCPSPTE